MSIHDITHCQTTLDSFTTVPTWIVRLSTHRYLEAVHKSIEKILIRIAVFRSKVDLPNVPLLTLAEYAPLCEEWVEIKMSLAQHLDVTTMEVFDYDDEDAKPHRVSRKRESMD